MKTKAAEAEEPYALVKTKAAEAEAEAEEPYALVKTSTT